MLLRVQNRAPLALYARVIGVSTKALGRWYKRKGGLKTALYENHEAGPKTGGDGLRGYAAFFVSAGLGFARRSIALSSVASPAGGSAPKSTSGSSTSTSGARPRSWMALFFGVR